MLFRIAILIILFSLVSTSCKKVNAGKGEKKDHIVEVGEFNRIEIKADGIINYTEDSTQHIVSINTTDDVFKILEVSVDNNTLIIAIKKGYKISNSEEIIYTIHSSLVNDFKLTGKGIFTIHRTTEIVVPRSELIIEGSGEIHVNQMNSYEQYSLISGSGEIHLNDLETVQNSTFISGTGDIALYGSTTNSYFNISGTGNIYSYPMESKYTTCNVSGSAGMRVNADSSLNVNVSGYANIYYKGFPQISSDFSGDGELIEDN